MEINTKLAIVTYSLKMGGVESVIFNLCKGFEKRGYEVEVIETLEIGVWKCYFQEQGIKVISIVKNPYFSEINHVKRIANYLKKFKIILLNDAPLAQSILGLLNKRTIIFSIMHMSLPSMAKNASLNFDQLNKIIAVSPFLKTYLIKQASKLKNTDVVCIPNGIDIEKFSIKSKSSRDLKKIVFMGRLSSEKGVMLIPEIIKKIANNVHFQCLDIYGTGPLESSLLEKIKERNLQSKINFKGHLNPSQVPDVLKDYDLLIMPSFQEGHPMALLEAMSSGVIPIVTFLEGSTNIVVEHDINGYLCESGNIDDFVFNINKALFNKSLDSFSLLANKKIIQDFSIDKMIQSYEYMFKQHLNESKLRSSKIEFSLLGDLPYLPYLMVRPVRKILRLLKLWTKN